eukprot:m51a1_g13955 hypothetical protein (69) ;mRNA; r:936531-936792
MPSHSLEATFSACSANGSESHARLAPRPQVPAAAAPAAALPCQPAAIRGAPYAGFRPSPKGVASDDRI